ncbi:hypothetical protein LOTGIDRAFT_220073 [Lottia gigantea]|uniref:Alpha-and gamma-adaptin-binding protein p34 n=1 Tax=Lottia gigantea TaxID=225164 RepID=V4A2T1_LOTGI|nr:hypothetical protein LOTGIDRAFT_220073 [Lottia gigantea]ESO87611.1 hypothetical protein LOTGIDRAFT_220073 [Lottia gigantea]
MAAPCALFASCSSFQTDEFIKRILNISELPPHINICDDIQAYSWDVNTKYYTATIHLCTTEKRTIGDQNFAESVQAFIVHFDNDQEKGLKNVESWLPFIDQLEVDIKLLVCNTATDTKTIKRLTIQNWCLDNNFELVELQPEETSDSEDEFAETTGIKRIIQALHSHTWSNLQMKENPDVRSPYIKELMREESESKALSTSNEEDTEIDKASDTTNTNTASGDNVQPYSMITDNDRSILTALGDDTQDEENFEQLFEKLKVMKDKAESLPQSERKAYAEKVAISFWKAIGGDDDDIDGLTDSDDNGI